MFNSTLALVLLYLESPHKCSFIQTVSLQGNLILYTSMSGICTGIFRTLLFEKSIQSSFSLALSDWKLEIGDINDTANDDIFKTRCLL